MNNSIDFPIKKENNGEIFTLKIKNKNNNRSNIVDNTKCNIPLPLKLNILDNDKSHKPLKLVIVNKIEYKNNISTNNISTNNISTNNISTNNISTNNISTNNKPLRLIIVNKIKYEDNILFFNSIINEAKLFLDSVPEMKKMIPPIIFYKKGCRYNYDTVINRSREKFGLIFDYSLNNPEDVNHSKSNVTVRCMICTYKQITSAESHLNGKGCRNCGNSCKWYYEIFIYKAFLIHGDKFIYPIIERNKIITTSQHLDIVCKKCKHVWPITIISHIHSKSGCPKCPMDEKRWNYDKLMKAVVRVHGYKYNYSKVIHSEINSCCSQLTVICNTCDYEWYPMLYPHISGETGCPSCAGNAPWTYERFLIAAFRIHGNKYYYGLVKPEDICNNKSIIKLWCGKCDYYWETNIVNHIVKETGCKSCSKTVPWTYDLFIKRTKITHGNKYNYELVSPNDIKNCKSIINVICLTCKYQWPTTINIHIYSKSNCPKCMHHLAYTLEILITKIIEIHCDNFDYSLIESGHIRNSKSYVPLICNICKKCWSPSINSLVNHKTGCPRCKISKGERACLNYLFSNNIFFEEQFKILELGMKRFDFMIEHNKLKYVIEFDGVQHFKFVEYFHKLPNVFIERQEIDILKTITALKCGYNVIRIDYKQIENVNFHISEALKLKDKTYFSTPELYTHIIRQLETI
jgi:very-short-patch-repair endonuclease